MSHDADDARDDLEEVRRIAVPVLLFFATALSMVITALAAVPVAIASDENLGFLALLERAYADDGARASAFASAGALLAILTAHEAGHFIAARVHGVPVSLPHFLPFPLLSPFGTLGAVIRMPYPVRDRMKLFDIGAAGPLAGLAIAIPLYAYGVATSTRLPRAEALGHGVELGSSLLSLGLEALFAPAGGVDTELVLSPVAFGAWGGFLLTMLNLLPVAQLDGGHVATALFGNGWAKGACIVHRAMYAAFFALALGPGLWSAAHGESFTLVPHAGRATFWFVWSQLVVAVAGGTGAPSGMATQTRIGVALFLAFLGANETVRASEGATALWLALIAAFFVVDLTRSGFADESLAHAQVTGEGLGPLRQVVAWCTLAFFLLLLMPWPMSV